MVTFINTLLSYLLLLVVILVGGTFAVLLASAIHDRMLRDKTKKNDEWW